MKTVAALLLAPVVLFVGLVGFLFISAMDAVFGGNAEIGGSRNEDSPNRFVETKERP